MLFWRRRHANGNGNGDGNGRPSFQGWVSGPFLPVAEAFARQIARRGLGGAFAVYHQGEKVVDVWAGARDAEGTPWAADTMALSFSTTKGVTATLFHILADRGLLQFEEPVARYWPEFAACGKSAITVGQVLCHETGLYGIRDRIRHAREMLDWDRMVGILEAAEPAFPPGEACGYQALTHAWLAGELLRRITGRDLDGLLEDSIVRPLSLDGLSFGAPPNRRHRVAALSWSSTAPLALLRSVLLEQLASLLPIPLRPSRLADALLPEGVLEFFRSREILDSPLPSANGVFTARSLAKMYAAIAHGGEIEGVRLLSSAAALRMGRIQNRSFDRVIGIPMLWRLGYHMVPTTRGILRRAFGHFGYGGSGAFADPTRSLAAALVVNRVAGTPIGDFRMLELAAATARAADSAPSRQ